MDAIEQICMYMEDGTVPKDCNVQDLMSAVDKLRAASPDKYLSTYKMFREFNRPMLTRSDSLPNAEQTEQEVRITIHEAKP